MAAYYALKIVKELGLPLSKKVRLILGADEESRWRCMAHYFRHEPERNKSLFYKELEPHFGGAFLLCRNLLYKVVALVSRLGYSTHSQLRS